MLGGFLAGTVLCTQALAIVPSRPADDYSNIPDRNIFGLRAPSAQPSEIPPPQLPKITLTGITTILGNKRALMLVQAPGSKAGQKELSLILTEGQQQDDIEVLQIDENAGKVKVNNSGTVMTLTFEKDGPKLPSTPAPAKTASPLLPGVVAPPTTGTNTNQLPGTYTSPGLHFPIPSRILRSPASQTPGVLSPTGGGPLPGTSASNTVPAPAAVPASVVANPPSNAEASENPPAEQIVFPEPEVPRPVSPAPLAPIPQQNIQAVAPAPMTPGTLLQNSRP